MKQQSRQSRSRRRLAFERCEERFALSGEGGFIDFAAGDFLSPAASDFVDVDLFLPWNPSPLGVPGVVVLNLGNATVSNHDDLRGVAQLHPNLDSGALSDGDSSGILTKLPLAVSPEVPPTVSRTAEPPFEPAPLARHEDPPAPDPPFGAGSEEASRFVSSPEIQALPESTEAPTLLPITVSQTLKLGKYGVVLEQSNQDAGDAPAPPAEGGPIEVTQVVTETQQAYEAEVFAAVAAQLDAQDVLAQPAPPAAQPLASELARSVAFEMVGLEPSADTLQIDHSHGPSAALPVVPAVNSISALTETAETEEADESRALAFAQWPLFFSATLGLVLAGSRRRPQPAAAQQPPRRNRQAIAS